MTDDSKYRAFKRNITALANDTTAFGPNTPTTVNASNYYTEDVCYKQIETESSNNSVGAEVKSHKPIAVGYTPSEVGDTQEPTIEDVKDDYVSGEINIVELENKLEEIIEIDE